MMRIGVDTGGTFTDFVSSAGDRLIVHKVRSTPDDPSRAILTGVAELVTQGAARSMSCMARRSRPTPCSSARARAWRWSPPRASKTSSASAVRRGRELYNIFVPAPRPLVDPALTFGVRERLDAAGAVLDAGRRRRRRSRSSADLAQSDVDIVAVCLLHSYVNPGARAARSRRGCARPACTSAPRTRCCPSIASSSAGARPSSTPTSRRSIERYLGRLEERDWRGVATRDHAVERRLDLRGGARARRPCARCCPARPRASSARGRWRGGGLSARSSRSTWAARRPT